MIILLVSQLNILKVYSFIFIYFFYYLVKCTLLLIVVPGQFLRIGWKLLMFGDDTWLKLFPGMFARHDGVSSFFVSLFYDRHFSNYVLSTLQGVAWFDLFCLT